MLLLKMALFGISSWGYWELLRKKTGLNVYFLPIVTIAVQFSALFMGGLLHILQETAFGLYLMGLALAVFCPVSERKLNWKPYCNWGYGFLLLGIALVFLHVHDAVFTHNDNFTHWAVIVQKMLEVDRFPNFMDPHIGFPYYPLGTSAYLYYFCKLVGDSEVLHMMAQSFMMLSAMLPLFAFSKRNPVETGVFLTALTAMIFGYSIRITELLVDTLLPLVGMSTVVYILYSFGSGKSAAKDNQAAVWLAAPLLIWLAQIKNSGLLFAVLAVVIMLLLLRRNPHTLWRAFIVAASPLLSTFLWSRHCAESFPQDAQEKHAMSAMNYLSTLSEKSMDDAAWIVRETIRYLVSRDGLFWLAVWLVVLGVLTLLFLRTKVRKYWYLLGSVAAIHGIYMIGMVGMYLFSMPIEEAMTLASIERYARTLDIAVYYLIAVYVVILISECSHRWIAGLVCIVFVLLSSITVKQMPDSRPWMTLEHRQAVEQNIAEYGIEKNRSYFICIPEYDKHHYYKLIHNFLLGEMPCAQRITDESQLQEAQNYDYLINMDTDNSVIQNWIAEHYPDQANQAVIYLP